MNSLVLITELLTDIYCKSSKNVIASTSTLNYQSTSISNITKRTADKTSAHQKCKSNLMNYLRQSVLILPSSEEDLTNVRNNSLAKHFVQKEISLNAEIHMGGNISKERLMASLTQILQPSYLD